MTISGFTVFQFLKSSNLVLCNTQNKTVAYFLSNDTMINSVLRKARVIKGSFVAFASDDPVFNVQEIIRETTKDSFASCS